MTNLSQISDSILTLTSFHL